MPLEGEKLCHHKCAHGVVGGKRWRERERQCVYSVTERKVEVISVFRRRMQNSTSLSPGQFCFFF